MRETLGQANGGGLEVLRDFPAGTVANARLVVDGWWRRPFTPRWIVGEAGAGCANQREEVWFVRVWVWW